jgi:hypothetical protein
LRTQADLVAEERNREVADRGTQGGVDLQHRLADDLERLLAGHAAPTQELHLEAATLHLRADLRAGAVHDDDRLDRGEVEDQVGGALGDRAAALHDDRTRHER